MKDSPKFTVGIPLCGNQKFLTRTLRSLSEQTYSDFEILFINDAQEDCDVEFLEKLSQSFGQIRLINNPKEEGISNCRNKLIDNAKGEYIIFVSPGDCIAPDLLSTLREYAYDYVDLIKFQMDGDNPKFEYPATQRAITGREAIKYFSEDSQKKYAVANTLCYRRYFLRWCGFRFPEDRKIYEDVAAIPFAIASSQQFAISDYKGYHYSGLGNSKPRTVKEIEARQTAFQSALIYAGSKVAEIRMPSDTKKEFNQDMLRRRYAGDVKFSKMRTELIKRTYREYGER